MLPGSPFRPGRSPRVRFLSTWLLAAWIGWWPTWLAASWQVVPDGNLAFEVVRDGVGGPVAMAVGTPSWGPSWGWFGYGGSAGVAGSNYTYTANLTVGGKAASVQFNAGAAGAEVVLDYAYTAGAEDVGFTLVACGLSAKTPFTGGTVRAEREDGSDTTQTLPLSGRGAFPAGNYRRFDFTAADGAVLTVWCEPARPTANESNEIRVELVGSNLPAGTTRATRLRLQFEEAPEFFPRESDSWVRTEVADWFPYRIDQYGSPLDLSFLNRDPAGALVAAGAHGFLGVAGENFRFADGTPARFWGLNVTAGAAFGSDARAAQIADRLARLGCNLVRLHHIDSWATPIIDYSHPDGTSQHLQASSLQRLDRIIHELKQRGIYVVLDPWVQRYFKENDGVDTWTKFNKNDNFHLHPYCFFDPRMGQLIRQTVLDVWNHPNPLTGLAWKDDPVFAFTGMANEVLMQRGANHVTVEPYRTRFIALYEDWAQAHDGQVGLGAGIITNNYAVNNQKFYIQVMRDFYRTMAESYRAGGVRVPMNGSNWFLWPWEVAANLDMDYLDSHSYYGGDQIGPGSYLGGNWLEHRPGLPGGPWNQLLGMSVRGKPLVSSELGNNPPKTYRATYPLGLAAVSALQEWDALLGYAFTQSASPGSSLSDFEWETDPVTLAMWAAGALVYRRADVRPANTLAVMPMDENEQYAFNWQNGGNRSFHTGARYAASAEQRRARLAWSAEVPAEAAADEVFTPGESFAHTPPAELRSDHGQLWRDWTKGVGTIDTPRTQAAYGRLGQHPPLATSGASFAIATPFASVVLTSAGWGPIDQSNRLFLIVAARAENTGQAANHALTRIEQKGAAPVLCEPVTGTVRFRTNQQTWTLHPLRADGTRGPGEPVPVTSGEATATLLATHQTLFYELVGTGEGLSLAQWTDAHPGLPPDQRGRSDDPDRDGLDNALEYFFGLDPLAADAPAAWQAEADGGHLRFRFRRARQCTELGFRVEWSDRLEGGWRLIPPADLTVGADLGAARQYEAVVPVGEGQPRFVRLVVEGL